MWKGFNMKKYELLAFDFDGTLFDTEETLFKAYQLAYFDLGFEITYEMFKKVKGFSVCDFNEIMGVKADIEKLKKLKSRYYAQFSTLAKPNKYLINLLKNYNSAIVTSAKLTDIQPLLKKYDLNPNYLVSQEDVRKYKPAPDCYNILLEQSGFSCEKVLAFEDSRPGFVSARTAGIDCVEIDSFQENCIKDMSGGSSSKTFLVLEKGNLLVKKFATGKDKEDLKLQWQWIEEHPGKNFVSSVKHEETKDSFSYYMEYYFAPNLHKYINKIHILPKVAELLSQLSKGATSSMNKEDIRKEMFNNYIEQASLLTNKEILIHLNEIPEFVNNFRITSHHGDSTFENILINRDESIMFIDPVPYRNIIHGIVHDFSKLGQSLCGYENIRDGIETKYLIEKNIFNELSKKYLTEDEYKSLKFYTACLYLRRMKYQVIQNYDLVEPYYNIAKKLFEEFKCENYEW